METYYDIEIEADRYEEEQELLEGIFAEEVRIDGLFFPDEITTLTVGTDVPW